MSDNAGNVACNTKTEYEIVDNTYLLKKSIVINLKQDVNLANVRIRSI